MTEDVMRVEVQEATRFPKEPGDMTLGELARWSANLGTFFPFTPAEEVLVTEQWMLALVAINQREGLSNIGGLAYVIDQESRLLLEKETQK